MISKNSILRFNNLSQFLSITHGFSTRFFGSLRPSHPEFPESFNKFSKALNVDPQKIVRMNQVHGNTVYFASEKDGGQVITETDGLMSETKGIFLSVITGDCIPLLFYNPKLQIFAAVHAGWRGLYKEIIKEAVSKFVSKGSSPKDIVVGIGPCIRVCCYDIPRERADQFIAEIPDLKEFIVERREKLFLDIPKIAIFQLRSHGVLLENIEDANYCTFDHKDIYSYRREGEDFGEMMGIIGIYE